MINKILVFFVFVPNMFDSFEKLTVTEDMPFLRFVLSIKDFFRFVFPTFWTSLRSLLMKISLFLFESLLIFPSWLFLRSLSTELFSNASLLKSFCFCIFKSYKVYWDWLRLLSRICFGMLSLCLQESPDMTLVLRMTNVLTKTIFENKQVYRRLRICASALDAEILLII